MKVLRTSPPEYFLPPVQADINKLAVSANVNANTDIVSDICNLEAGGVINAPETYLPTVSVEAEKTLRYNEEAKQWSGNYYRDPSRDVVLSKTIGKEMTYHSNVSSFLRHMDRSELPGSTPLERSISALKLLAAKHGELGKPARSGNGSIPLFNEMDGQQVADSIRDLVGKLKALTADQKDLLDPTGQHHKLDRQDGTRHTDDGFLDKLHFLEVIADQRNSVILEISRKLEWVQDFKTYKLGKEEADPEGDNVRYRPIEDPYELPMVAPEQMANYLIAPGLFWADLQQGALDVRETTKYLDRRQIMYIAIDGSGSMQGTRHDKACGIVYNRLNAVLKGEAEVWLGVFDGSLHHLGHARNRTEGLKLLKIFQDKNFTGGSTNITTAITGAHEIVTREMEDKRLVKPEIWVITDEDSSSSGITKDKIPGFKVHGFAMDASNKQLKNLVESTGGIYREDL